MMEKGDRNLTRMAWWEPDVVPAVSGPLGSGKFGKSSKNGAPVEGEYRDTIEPEGLFSSAYNSCVIGKYPAVGY